ncbi:polysaccharide biosynthesis/export family protein [Pseudobacter ginsenosidimutans]|uniref:Polysaccharide export outer membrane protein n=1 Tax=Pseudobacter ginsenosidimutans TaxID=661488 RepID=A0A4Q7MTM4_9BACT|nr:polysaccharide biosynthesis/export family protein [Pseudobacter ginsenosidimutans]QEC41053.1 polysaccharide export protein [Pseudobacter ginsenosidimutans]RZS72195.1 polysaccharide export outer membrane protein [Pseudobacter ginsenosidimutans]
MHHRLVLFLLVVGIVIIGTSCGSSRKSYNQALYFRDLDDSLSRLAPQNFEQRFQPGDILYVGVSTPNEKMAAILNQPVSMPVVSPGGGALGYLVENDSMITFPLLGKIKIAGMTKNEVTRELTEKLRYHVDSPIVTVRLLNYRITILGEVARPGTISIPNERVSILDALGLAGDLTIWGIRDSVRVIRQNEGMLQTGFINLNSGNFYDSPYYYLKQNDVVYVKMQKRKLAATDQVTLRNISIGLGILSTLGLITTTIINISNR